MIKSIQKQLLFSFLFCLTLGSCKKDLDHELNSNIYDEAYQGPEPISIEYFQPVYSTAHLRNVLRIKLKWNVPREKSTRGQVFKDGTYMAFTYGDTNTIVTDFYTLPGQTHSYHAVIKAGDYYSSPSEIKSFTMY